MATRRRYTKTEKIAAVVAAEMTTAAAAAVTTGIPETNIRRWQDDPVLAEYGAKTREQLAEGSVMLAALAVEKIARAVQDDKFEPRDLTILYGVAVEKSQLLSGGPTSRTETRSLANDLSDDEKQRLRNWIDSLPADSHAEGTPL